MLEKMNESAIAAEGVEQMLSQAGYSPKAIRYYIDRPYMGILPNADQVSQMTGTCGDTMGVYLRLDEEGRIRDVRYQVLGCAGAVSAAMALVDIVKGKTLAEAEKIDDGDVFQALEDIPAKKHHCIQLAVKTLHKAIKAYKNGRNADSAIKKRT